MTDIKILFRMANSLANQVLERFDGGCDDTLLNRETMSMLDRLAVMVRDISLHPGKRCPYDTPEQFKELVSILRKADHDVATARRRVRGVLPPMPTFIAD